MSERIRSLQAKHAKLEQDLTREEARPSPSTMAVAQLKKEKLRIKDELSRLVH
ncbi:MAG: YdcH family protein [Tagaea sp.]|nr:YdcH family protein [Magnetospirillum sp.]